LILDSAIRDVRTRPVSGRGRTKPNKNPQFSKNRTELELRCRKNKKIPNRTEPNLGNLRTRTKRNQSNEDSFRYLRDNVTKEPIRPRNKLHMHMCIMLLTYTYSILEVDGLRSQSAENAHIVPVSIELVLECVV